jgi:outer membrane protein TolC
VRGELANVVDVPDSVTLTELAIDNRADLHARLMAVQEGEARLKLEIANRFANPSIGPAWEYNETSVNFVGLWSIWSLPVFNLRQGDILQRRAELQRAILEVNSSRVVVEQDVQAALSRLRDAQAWVNTYKNEVLPTLRQTQAEFDRVLAEGGPGVDISRVIDIRRRVLRAWDVYLDALWELSQARADLAAAIGDPMAGCTCAAPPSAPAAGNSAKPNAPAATPGAAARPNAPAAIPVNRPSTLPPVAAPASLNPAVARTVRPVK